MNEPGPWAHLSESEPLLGSSSRLNKPDPIGSRGLHLYIERWHALLVSIGGHSGSIHANEATSMNDHQQARTLIVVWAARPGLAVQCR